ncbi:RICIN domain-containing protein [Actinomadura kijaniata]|uniref:RICIN domain-containing protein n=1 Tax=Actinomadura kijaniata TaxID=46161 RepID=UPI00083346D4|nr:RICIN domain-containing protein [Actinomadura kijaniata]
MRKRLALTATAAMAAALTSALTSAAPAQATPQAAAAAPGPFYWIVNNDTGKALLPYQHSKDSGQPLIQSNEFNGGATHWKIRTTPNDTMLENRHSHLCANALVAGGLMRQEYCGSPGTKWWVSSTSDMWAGRPVTFRNLQLNNQCMTAFGAATKATTCIGATTQYFKLVHVPGT